METFRHLINSNSSCGTYLSRQIDINSDLKLVILVESGWSTLDIRNIDKGLVGSLRKEDDYIRIVGCS